MVEYRVLSTFVSRRLNTDLKDFTFDLWKKRGTMKTVKICGKISAQPHTLIMHTVFVQRKQ